MTDRRSVVRPSSIFEGNGSFAKKTTAQNKHRIGIFFSPWPRRRSSESPHKANTSNQLISVSILNSIHIQHIKMDSINALASNCKPANTYDKVLNSECAYTFHSPFTTDKGIVVNLQTYIGTVEEMAFTNSNEEEALFVRIVKKRIPKPTKMETDTDNNNNDSQQQQPTKLGIGVDGGFPGEDDKYEIQSTYSLVIMKKGSPTPTIVTEVPYDPETKSTTFSEHVIKLVDSVILHAGMTVQQDVKVWQLDTDETIVASKYYKDLPFVDNGVMIDPNPSSWKCQKSGDTNNLWLNLSDGYIGGGRKNWDGSGGSNGALDHYHETGEKYPLVVKLGTSKFLVFPV